MNTMQEIAINSPMIFTNIFLNARSCIIKKTRGRIESIRRVFSDLNNDTDIIGKITPIAEAVRSTK